MFGKIYISILIVFLCAITIFEFIVPESNFVVYSEDSICLWPLPEGLFTICSPLDFHVGPNIIVIPRGFTSDLSSIPRVLWPLYSPTDYDTISPAILHDYLYTKHLNYSRYEIDKIFYLALRSNGMPMLSSFNYWAMVRIFGGQHFKENNGSSSQEKSLARETFQEERDSQTKAKNKKSECAVKPWKKDCIRPRGISAGDLP